jgi:hypothetical protein
VERARRIQSVVTAIPLNFVQLPVSGRIKQRVTGLRPLATAKAFADVPIPEAR